MRLAAAPHAFLSFYWQLGVFTSCFCHDCKEADCLQEASESAQRLKRFLSEIGKTDEQEIEVISAAANEVASVQTQPPGSGGALRLTLISRPLVCQPPPSCQELRSSTVLRDVQERDVPPTPSPRSSQSSDTLSETAAGS